MAADEERYHRTQAISWKKLHQDCRTLASKVNRPEGWEKIVAVARGGLIPAGLLAQELSIRNIDTLCISTYTLRSQGEAHILKSLSSEDGGRDWLIIDDLVDTGKTSRLIRELLPKAYFATVYAKPEGRPFVDLFIEEFSQDTWIHFPWEPAPTNEDSAIGSGEDSA